jgi:hypothetical protein
MTRLKALTIAETLAFLLGDEIVLCPLLAQIDEGLAALLGLAPVPSGQLGIPLALIHRLAARVTS